jgi:hypothetical protein
LKPITPDGAASLTGTKTGEYTITVSLSKRGYNSVDISVSVTVYPHTMELSANLTDDMKISLKFRFFRARNIAAFKSPSRVCFDVNSSDEEALSFDVQDYQLRLTANKSGQATLTVTARCEGYNDAILTIQVNISPQKEELVPPLRKDCRKTIIQPGRG